MKMNEKKKHLDLVYVHDTEIHNCDAIDDIAYKRMTKPEKR